MSEYIAGIIPMFVLLSFFIFIVSFERLKSLTHMPKGEKYVISENILSQLAVLE